MSANQETAGLLHVLDVGKDLGTRVAAVKAVLDDVEEIEEDVGVVKKNAKLELRLGHAVEGVELSNNRVQFVAAGRGRPESVGGQLENQVAVINHGTIGEVAREVEVNG
jgi:hypothetical protein